MNNSNSNNAPFVVSEVDLCKRFGVECLIVGDVYDVDEHDRPIPEEVRKKWMVTTPAGPFPRVLVEAIPLAASKDESVSLAVKYLMLRDRETFTDLQAQQAQANARQFPVIPTPA